MSGKVTAYANWLFRWRWLVLPFALLATAAGIAGLQHAQFKGDYRIVYLDDAYTKTVIGRQKRDYVWIMARTPDIPHEEYRQIVEFVGSIGYDVDKIREVPQRWPDRTSSD